MVDILKEARELVDGSRQDSYGHPAENFARAAVMISAVLDTDVSPEQVALIMCCIKISRQIGQPDRDNLVDLCGYAHIMQVLEDERKRRFTPNVVDKCDMGSHSRLTA